MTGDVQGRIEVFRHYGYEKSEVNYQYEDKQLIKTFNLDKIDYKDNDENAYN